MKIFRHFSTLLFSVFFVLADAQNPIIRNQFTADPTARVFNGKVYLFPSHDIPAPSGKNLRKDWFCMADYHVFSSDNLVDWKDNGVILSQNDVAWVDSTAYSMWAPDCIERNGKYYFYFPSIRNQTDENGRKSFGIGVAIADKPEGPYKALPEPIKNLMGIDPCVFIDKDGQAYLYWAMGRIYGAKLKDNMTELESEPVVLGDLPQKGMKEGPFVFERNGIYYLTFPHVENSTERIEYAIGNNPLGTFKMTGVIMDESPEGCWTNHQSIVEYKGQWYLFYHDKDLSPQFDKNRSVRIDSLFFNADGTIRKVIPTLRGVGLSDATKEIQIDRYSNIGGEGTSIAFLDTVNPFNGWKTVFHAAGAWVQYNGVQFTRKVSLLDVRVMSATGSSLELRLNNPTGTVVAKINVPPSLTWTTVTVPISDVKTGIQNIVLIATDNRPVDVDWIRFQ